MERVYAAIDYKSFYASVECMHRGLDPLRAHLVVADESRTSKTICLAVSPAMKALGLPGRCRLFEVEKKVREYEARSGKKLSRALKSCPSISCTARPKAVSFSAMG